MKRSTETDAEKADQPVMSRVSLSIKRKLEKATRAEGISEAAYVRRLLKQHFLLMLLTAEGDK